MATAQTLVTRAIRLCGLIGSGESPTSDESSDGLVSLNAMLESWATERLNIYAFQKEVVTFIAGTQTYTIGPSGLPVTVRPLKIEDAYVTENSIDYPSIAIVDYQRWNAIADKTSQSDIPTMIYYEPTMPNGTLKVYPVPNTTNTLNITTRIQLVAFAALSTAVSLPPGYERALAYNLAVEIAPEYETEASNTVQQIAKDSKANIMRMNQRPMVAYPDINFGMQGFRRDIYTDGANG